MAEYMNPVRTAVRLPDPLLATFAAGATVSTVVAVPDGFRIEMLEIPASWVAADMTLFTSGDGTTYQLAKEYGNNITLRPVAGGNTCIGYETSGRISKRYIKLQSGLEGATVAQAAGCTIKLWLISQ